MRARALFAFLWLVFLQTESPAIDLFPKYFPHPFELRNKLVLDVPAAKLSGLIGLAMEFKDREQGEILGIVEFSPSNARGKRPDPGLPEFGLYLGMRRKTIYITAPYPDELTWSYRQPEIRRDFNLFPSLRNESGGPTIPTLAFSEIRDDWNQERGTHVGLFYRPSFLRDIPIWGKYKGFVGFNIAGRSFTDYLALVQLHIHSSP